MLVLNPRMLVIEHPDARVEPSDARVERPDACRYDFFACRERLRE